MLVRASDDDPRIRWVSSTCSELARTHVIGAVSERHPAGRGVRRNGPHGSSATCTTSRRLAPAPRIPPSAAGSLADRRRAISSGRASGRPAGSSPARPSRGCRRAVSLGCDLREPPGRHARARWACAVHTAESRHLPRHLRAARRTGAREALRLLRRIDSHGSGRRRIS